jgi:hypothetical protein
MIFTYDKTTKNISVYDETDFKSQNILERQDLEKWIESYPDLLGEELLIITTEYDKFDKTNERLDLLAIDKEGNLVIVELKRDDSGKYVDLQAIKYAAYCSTLTLDEVSKVYLDYLAANGEKSDFEDVKSRIIEFIDNDEFEELNDSPRIILVSREFRPEVTASVLWLRKFGLDIRCIKLSPFQMDEDTIIFSSNTLIPLPEAEDFIIKSEQKDKKEHTLTLTQQGYLNFYNDVSSRFKKEIPVSLSTPTTRSYYQIPTGIGGFHFEWAFHGRPRSSFGVELHLEKGSAEINYSACSKIEKLKSQIEDVTGEKVIFQQNWGKRWSRIYIEKNEGKFTDELKEWAVNKMVIFYNLLRPELEKL